MPSRRAAVTVELMYIRALSPWGVACVGRLAAFVSGWTEPAREPASPLFRFRLGVPVRAGAGLGALAAAWGTGAGDCHRFRSARIHGKRGACSGSHRSCLGRINHGSIIDHCANISGARGRSRRHRWICNRGSCGRWWLGCGFCRGWVGHFVKGKRE